MAENRAWDTRCACIGAALCNLYPELEVQRGKTVAYLVSDAKKSHGGKTVFGDCRKVPSRDHWAKPFDYEITVYANNITGFTDEQLAVLIYHELLHVGEKSVTPHDMEDFRAVVERFGTRWDTQGADVVEAERVFLHRTTLEPVPTIREVLLRADQIEQEERHRKTQTAVERAREANDALVGAMGEEIDG